MNYNEYHFSLKQMFGLILTVLLITIGISYLFYRSFWGIVLSPVLFFLLKRRKRRLCIEERRKKLHGQFMESLKIVSTCLMSGMSMENAWRDAAEEMAAMYGEESIISLELEEMNRYVQANETMEKVLLQFAYRTGIEDIISFAEVFAYGKRNGANWRSFINDTTLRMEEKYETEKQIEVMLAEKRMEQKVMSVMPLGMLLFLQISSGEYMDVLYGNPFGVFCMTICLIGYGIALSIAEKIMKIQV